MFEKIIVGRSLNKLKSSPKVRYSKIVVEVDKNTKYTAGDDSAGTLTVKIPWGNQTIADNLLKQYKNYEYQPYKAESGIVDPSAEIGDGITAGRVYGGLFQQDLTFGKIPKSNFSAPQQEQINHEYPYTPKRDREVNREIGGVKTSLKVQAGLISAEVEERKRLATTVSENSTKISQNAEGITAEITAREEAINKEAAARGELEGTVNGIGTLVSEHSTKIEANSNGISAEITAREELAGTVNGLSNTVSENTAQISATSQKLSAEVTARETLEGVVSGHTSTLSQQADLISAKVSTTGGDYSSFSWEMLSDSMSWYANSQQIFKLSKSGGEFTGTITAKGGLIGGFTISDGNLHTGSGSWSACNPGEISVSPSGINISDNFLVDSQGNLTCENGTFHGTVQAKQIQYGPNDGYFNGTGLKANTVTGGQWGKLSTGDYGVSSFNVTSGIATSLGYADTANSVLFGSTKCTNCLATGTLSGNNVNASTTFTFKGYNAKWIQFQGTWVLSHS